MLVKNEEDRGKDRRGVVKRRKPKRSSSQSQLKTRNQENEENPKEAKKGRPSKEKKR